MLSIFLFNTHRWFIFYCLQSIYTFCKTWEDLELNSMYKAYK
ncbi:hypothetical protein HMPREF9144_0313 [Prevotella pallens ATCC 700821]|uniref:Uncharacterized protein n=1 Tax=Prevotella pallens ATCC 700821 TaxID=997353 RepID=F9DF73_9BACT|nr:hypothetical protein HMPREF9144_0313 [Prevotella pallens ATCC 700821]